MAPRAKVGGIDVSLWGDELQIVSEPDTIAALRRLQTSSETTIQAPRAGIALHLTSFHAMLRKSLGFLQRFTF
jgi:hypothetical protein